MILSNVIRKGDVIQTVKHWLNVQESIFRQKSRTDWIKLCDNYNHYFFLVMKFRQARN